MNMKWIVAVVTIVVVGAIGYLVFSGSDDSTDTNESTQSTQESTNDAAERSTLNQLFARGENLECTYSYTDDSGNSNNGTAYFSGERMYGEFTVAQSEGQTLQSSVLKVDGYQYVWDKSTNQGYKLDLSTIDIDTDATVENNDQGPDQDEEFDFNCTSWNVDESKFEVPGDVTFVDNSQIIQNVQENVQNAAEACAALEGQARVACEQAVGAQ